jgi:DNA topoisomerase-1
MNVVIVESPAKAKTINRYLGDDYRVIASYGHVRDLSPRDGSVKPDADFAMEWEIDPKASRHIKEIAEALKGAKRLYLATDPDREGEAISWHVCEVLGERDALNGVDVKRVVFNEITRNAILDAFAQPRELDRELVDAYLARRALDYLVGFTLSPILWRKLPGSRSAGRVQSVALRLICERETEIESFRSQEYWTVKGLFATPRHERFEAMLTHLEGRKLEKLAISSQAMAESARAAILARRYAIARVERKQMRRQPPPPFITSTLQQEASRKLGFGASLTMRIAQRLYEGVTIGGETVGMITYMRTDGVQMAADAVSMCRERISRDYGVRYLPEKPRVYKSRVKNAQEAHECIRPTDINRTPETVKPYLDEEQFKLYMLIWKRTMACQMEAAVLDQVAADVVSEDGNVQFRATGSAIAFDGFLKVYREGRDDPERDADAPIVEDGDRLLPEMQAGEAADLVEVMPEQHFTQPPPRFTEASLVKRLEELGIGRPSTYASILSVLQERKYVRLEQKRFVPEDRGRLVTAFLTSFFERYVAFGFTAEMEQRLDDISDGRIDWRTVLSEFWRDFSAAIEETKGLRIGEVLDALDRLLGPHFFPPRDDDRDPRSCPACGDGRLSLRIGKFGAFVGCSNYASGCRYTRPLVQMRGEESGGEEGGSPLPNLEGEGHSLGNDPESGQPVRLRRGPYGLYLQLGDAGKDTAAKPKRVALPRGVDPAKLDLAQALAYLALPRTVGTLPETGEEITAGLGRFGPYLRAGETYVSLKGDDDVLAIGANRAIELLSRSTASKAKARSLGAHPADGKPVTVRAGRFGAYAAWGNLRVTLPKGVDAETLTLADAVALLDRKAGSVSAKGKGKVKAAAPKSAAPQRGEDSVPATKVKRPPTNAGGGGKTSENGRAAKRPRASRSQ